MVAILALAALVLGFTASALDYFDGKQTGQPFQQLYPKGTKFINVTNADELVSELAAAQDAGFSRVEIGLPPTALVLSAPLKITLAAHFRGVSAMNGSYPSQLKCGSGSMASLIDFSGSELHISGVHLQDCTCPGLNIASMRPTNITIEDCVFSNFTRILDSSRVNLLAPDAPASLSSSTAALAIHAGQFSGTLNIIGSNFTENRFIGSFEGSPVSRRLQGASLTSSDRVLGTRPDRRRGSERQSQPSRESVRGLAVSSRLRMRRGLRSTSLSMFQAELSSANTIEETEDNFKSLAEPHRQALEVASASQYSLPVLQEASNIHPGLQAGPWADDMEAVIAVVCSGYTGEPCSITLTNSVISDNCGVATSGLYVLCDNATACDVDLQSCTVTNNSLLWQQAAYLNNLSYIEDRGLWIWDDYVSIEGPGVSLFKAMVPWMTYTYPLLDYFISSGRQDYMTSMLADASAYPSVTGRTLGAIVLHQRNSPPVGSDPSSAAMMRIRVTGGTYNGNDGAAIMSTATDFMTMAGGNGSWSGGPPRHSADIQITDMVVSEHNSGLPAVWLRWARNVNITSCQVSNSTGAVWLDEVRDSVSIVNSSFIGNKLNHLWLDTLGFVSQPHIDDYLLENFGAGASHVVKVQMTPLGGVPNYVTIRDDDFKGNPSYTTGVLYIRASDVAFVDKDNQPGATQLNVTKTDFMENTCMLYPNECITGERSLSIINVYSVSLNECRFTNNANGGVKMDTIHAVTVGGDTIFDSNQLTCTLNTGWGDEYYGGAAIVAKDIGTGMIQIANTSFINNTAAIGGGAVHILLFDAAIIKESRFEGNTAASYDGGAVWLTVGTNTATLSKNYFGSNTAGRNGGAVAAIDLDSLTFNGLQVSYSSFVNNTALINPADRGPVFLDQSGGGAVFASGTPTIVENSDFFGNKVLGHAGGALRVVDSTYLGISFSTFENNIAVMGGALAVSRMSRPNRLHKTVFKNNTVVDPWAWPDTSPVKPSEGAVVPSLSYIDPGYGGAVYLYAVILQMQATGKFIGNSAKYGGAMALISCPAFYFNNMSRSEMDITPVEYVSVPAAVAQAAGRPSASSPATLPYRYLFQENTALIGGALYLFDTDITSIYADFYQRVRVSNAWVQSVESVGLNNQPAILFYKNLANGGGAAFLDGNGQVNLSKCRFVMNNASIPPLFANYSGLYGRERDYATAKAHPCYNGGGGGLCISGQAGTTLTLSASDFIANTAKDGAGIYLAEGLDCVDQAGCYQVVLDSVNVKDNNARSRGGAVFWTHEGILQITSCPSDTTQQYITDGRTLTTISSNLSASGNATQRLYNITLVFPKRKAPAQSYGMLSTPNQQKLLDAVGGPALSTNLKVVNETLVWKGFIYAKTITQNASTMVNGQLVAAKGAVLTRSGDVILPNANTLDDDLLLIEDAPVVVNGAIVYDAGWLGIPYTNLPCQSWANMASTGNEISTTPYFLTSPAQLKFYTSNTDITLSVTAHDWFGEPCYGDSSTQPLVIVQANSTEVSGAVTAPVVNGTANFTSLRMRAKEGVHSVAMIGQLYTPVREMLSAEVQIYVRPCTLNEFLSPNNLDECFPCDIGTYNLNVSAVACEPCPENAACGFPDPEACKGGVECKPNGFMVPLDGFWHANFFSEQVLECPNSDSCTFPNRSEVLATLQYQVWKATRNIQSNASNYVADAAALEILSKLVSSRDGMRRRLQEKAITDDENVRRVLVAVMTMTPAYSDGLCADGYTGTLCGECKPGYGWRRVATCKKCPSRALNNLYYALVTVLTLGTLGFTVFASLKEQKAPGRLVGGMGDKNNGRAGLSVDNAASNTPSRGGGLQLTSVAVGSVHLEQALAARTGYSHMSEQLAGASNRCYVDPAVAAARGHFSSAPGMPSGYRSTSVSAQPPIPAYDTAVRSQSAFGVPLDGNRTRLGRIEQPNRNPLIPAGPVAESTGNFTNVLFDDNREQNLDPDDSDEETESQVQTQEDPGVKIVGSTALMPAQYPMGVMMQSVPVMQSSPPESMRQHGVVPTSLFANSQSSVELRPQSRVKSKVPPRERAHESTIVKMFVSYIQVLALLQNVPLDIPGVVDLYYRINNQAISYPGVLVSLDCSLPKTISVSKAIIRVLLTVLAPFYIWLGAVLYFLVFNFLDYYFIMPYMAKRQAKKRKTKKRQLRMPTFGIHMEVFYARQLTVTFITIFFFFYPSVVQSLLTIFSCLAVNSSDTTNQLALGLGLQANAVWSQDFGLSCYEGTHMALAFGLGVPGVVLLALGWPIMNGLFMTGKLTCLGNISFTEDMTTFFLADFKQSYAWWESVVMVRKLLIAVVVTLIGDPTPAGVQLLLVVCILVISMGVHLYSMPYHHDYTNYLEVASLSTLLATLYFSLYFSFSTSISAGGQIGISILILVVNVVMVLVFIYYIIQAYWYSALQKTGLTALDAETRRRLTPAEIERKILENLASQGSTTSIMFENAQREQNNRSRVASIYAAAFWASMRVNSTTSKVLTRVRTFVDRQSRGETPLGDAPPSDQPVNGAGHGQTNKLDPEACLDTTKGQGKVSPEGADPNPVTKTVSTPSRSSPHTTTSGHQSLISPTQSNRETNSGSDSPAQPAALPVTRQDSLSSDPEECPPLYTTDTDADAVLSSDVSPDRNGELLPPPPALAIQSSQPKK